MREKYLVRYNNGFTVIFAGSLEEARKIFKKNYSKFEISEIQAASDIKHMNNVNGVPAIASNYAAMKISKNMLSSMTYHNARQQSMYDWFDRQRNSPGCKYHVFFVTKKPHKIVKDFFTKDIEAKTLHDLVDDYFKEEDAVDSIYIYYTEVNK